MDNLYAKIRQRAREIGKKHPEPAFYIDFDKLVVFSRESLENDPILKRLHKLVDERVNNDLGHGLEHAVKVTIDAGALFLIHANGEKISSPERGLLLVQAAGLLHDISRKEKHHAQAGAEAARKILADFPFSPDEVDSICIAIGNHEAFKTPEPCESELGQVISDCLYDADKFRWGPDNFTDTVWHMVAFFNAPLSAFLDRYPQGIDGIIRIKKTFRTPTGKKYGPDFVDSGLMIGEEICRMIRAEFL